MRAFLYALFSGIVFVTILTIGSFTAVINGVWLESDRLARLWEIQLLGEVRRGRPPLPMGYMGSLYWIIRMFAFVLMLIWIMGFSLFLYWIFFR
jgi:hypothetical protein